MRTDDEHTGRAYHPRFAELLGSAHNLRGFRDPASYEVRRTLAPTAHLLGDAVFDAAYERGRRVTRKDVFAAGTVLVHSTSPDTASRVPGRGSSPSHNDLA